MLSALPRCYVPSSSGSMYMYVGRKKGILTAGQYGMWWFAVKLRTQFSVSGGISCIKHTLCPEFRPVSKGGRHISIRSTNSTLITVSGLALQL